LFICFIIGGVLILVFARKNYNPIQELVSFVTGKASASAEKETDEYELIRRYFIKTIQERDDSKHQQVQHIKLLRKYFLSRLMKGHIEKEQSLEEVSKAYQISWSSDYFVVMLFHLESDKEASDEFQLLQFIISNVVTELIGYKHTLHFTDMDGTLAAILNIHPAGFDDWKITLEPELKEAREFIEKRYKFQFATTISELQSGLGGIHQAFMQALEALEYLMLLGDGKVVWYGDLKHTNKDYYYTVNQELILINLLKSCDFIQAREIVTGVIQSSFNQGNTSIEMLKCIMIDLVSTMMKLIQDQHDGSVWEELRPFRRLQKCNTKFEIEYQMLEIFNYVCQHIESKNKSISNLVKNEYVTEFVQENYHDSNLSVSLLGEHFSMTPQYLSRLFKEQRGQGLHEYICQTRIDHAKRLLLKGETIEDTARNTGFTSSSTFIKVFKKYEGITPGKYQFNG
jgi:AraC-like DNA-binding protein